MHLLCVQTIYKVGETQREGDKLQPITFNNNSLNAIVACDHRKRGLFEMHVKRSVNKRWQPVRDYLAV